MDRLRRFLQPGNTASIAAVLIAAGFEVPEPLLKHVLEIAGALIAILGMLGLG